MTESKAKIRVAFQFRTTSSKVTVYVDQELFYGTNPVGTGGTERLDGLKFDGDSSPVLPALYNLLVADSGICRICLLNRYELEIDYSLAFSAEEIQRTVLEAFVAADYEVEFKELAASFYFPAGEDLQDSVEGLSPAELEARARRKDLERLVGSVVLGARLVCPLRDKTSAELSQLFQGSAGVMDCAAQPAGEPAGSRMALDDPPSVTDARS